MKKSFLRKLLITSIITLLGFSSTTVIAETIELKLAHFMPEQHSQHRMVMAPWAKKIEADTNGRVKINIYPKGTLGKPPAQYENTVNGTIDIAFGLPSYTPDKFPLTGVMDLPFIISSGEQGSLVLWQLYKKYLQNEYKDTKILWMFTHGPGQIHTVRKPIKTLEDLKGIKFACSGYIANEIMKRLGGNPVQMPITQMYQALAEGKVEGVMLPYEGVRPFKLYEHIKYTTVANIYTTSFFVAMNWEKYNSLPADIRKTIDTNIGEQMSAKAGKAYDADGKSSREICIQNGVKIYKLPHAERERWKKAAMPVGDKWLKDNAEKGLPAKEVLEYAIDLLMQL